MENDGISALVGVGAFAEQITQVRLTAGAEDFGTLESIDHLSTGVDVFDGERRVEAGPVVAAGEAFVCGEEGKLAMSAAVGPGFLRWWSAKGLGTMEESCHFKRY